MRAQDRDRRGPFAALLILLSLVLGSASAAAAGSGTTGSATRLGSSRHIVAAALLPAGTRNPLEDEASSAGAGPSVLPSAPAIVTETLWATPWAEAPAAPAADVQRPTSASYRARAPPAF
jgi:hypothetical protein